MASNWELVRPLVETDDVPELGPGKAQASLAGLKQRLEEVLRGTALDKNSQALIRSGVLLWHDDLEASHVISQSIETPDGSYLHAIMHRREPDYGNSKYWFRRVGKHQTFSKLAAKAAPLLRTETELANRLIPRGEWDPLAFVDQCELAASLAENDPKVALLRQIQGLELRTLLEHFCGSV